MNTTITRRTAVLGVSSSLLLPAGCSTTTERPAANATFAHGVASGDPATDSVVLWTRVSGYNAAVDVRWVVARDQDFVDVVARGETSTDARRDYTVKVIAEQLEPGREYYYRFSSGSAESAIGRTRTLPNGRLDELTLAVTSCSNYQFGFFNVYEAIAADDAVDVVLHLGDYIYEYDIETYGGPIGQRIGRAHEPAHEMVSLTDYRQRHALYKTDPDSIAMHARHPLIPTWDDHESTNNPWAGGAQNHQPEEGDWLRRRADSLQAYYEWMPVRDPGPRGSMEKLWRHFRFGDLASLVTLESRHTARSEQIDVGDYEDQLTDARAAERFYADIVGDPSRRMLSAELEGFVAEALDESVRARRPWRIVANQTILANVTAPRLSTDPQVQMLRQSLDESANQLLDWLANFGNLELAGNMDAWDGYPAARERLYDIAKTANARDLLVLTGDTHMFWQNRLQSAAGEPLGVEIGTSAVTSPRGFAELGAVATRFDELTAERNDSVEWVDGSNRGYVRLTLNRERARVDYLAISNIESHRYAVNTVRSVDIEAADGSLNYA